MGSEIAPTRTVRFPSRDGLDLYGEFFAAANPRGVSLIVHGYGEHGGRYRELANILALEGMATLSFDLRGHGRADGQRGYVERFTDYLDDVDAALEQLDH